MTEMWLKKMMSKRWKTAIMALLCALRISNLRWWGMSVGEEQKETDVFCHQTKSGFRERHSNYKRIGEPSEPGWPQAATKSSFVSFLLRAWLLCFTGVAENLRNGPMRRDWNVALSSCVWLALSAVLQPSLVICKEVLLIRCSWWASKAAGLQHL